MSAMACKKFHVLGPHAEFGSVICLFRLKIFAGMCQSQVCVMCDVLYKCDIIVTPLLSG